MIKPIALNCITLSVRDIDSSMQWYKSKFGFEKLYDDAPNSKGIVIGSDNIQICLTPVDFSSPTVDHPKTVCVRLFGFKVSEDDLERSKNEFPEDKNIIVLDDHPRYRSRIIEDPDGHCFELYYER